MNTPKIYDGSTITVDGMVYRFDWIDWARENGHSKYDDFLVIRVIDDEAVTEINRADMTFEEILARISHDSKCFPLAGDC